MARYFSIKDNVHKREFLVDAPYGSQRLYCEIENIVGMKKTWFGVPYAIEVDGWGEDAWDGDTFEPDDDEFLVTAITREEYYGSML